MIYRSTVLSSSHYAAKWVVPDESQRYNLAAINQMGYDYAVTPESPEKEALLLRLLECFHGYLNKYLIMILRGTIPQANSTAGSGSQGIPMPVYSKGTPKSLERINQTCKCLHLAFKGETTETIYDTLAFCLMRAARRYDPHYTVKTKRVCEAIDAKQFTAEELAARVDFDCTGILRALVRKALFLSLVWAAAPPAD